MVRCGQSTDKKLREGENPQAHKITKIFSSFFWPKVINHFWKKFYSILQKDVILCNLLLTLALIEQRLETW